MGYFLGCLGVLFLYALSWLITCGLVYLICLCFGLLFTWPIATGIWLLMILLKGVFNITVNNKK